MTATATPLPPRQQSRRRLLLVWIALTVVLVVTIRDLPWRGALEQARQVQLPWLATAIAANSLIIPLWALEWRLLVPITFRVAYDRMFEVVSVTAAVLNSVPFFAGEASGVALLITRAGLPRGAALSVLALDQLLVGFAKLAVIAAAAAFVPLPGWFRAGILSLVAGVLLLLGVLVPLAHRWSSLRDRVRAQPSKLRNLAARAIAWGAHLEALRDVGRVWRLASLALAKKGAELAGILAIQMAFGLEPSVAGALLVLAALAITTLLPVLPANLGVYEATAFAAYRFLGVPAESAMGMAIVQHLAFLLPALATGYTTLTLQQLLPRRTRD
jgi:uncharacterized membrane protein YbhN (UPF0104 family)